jgi:hypothetical protein
MAAGTVFVAAGVAVKTILAAVETLAAALAVSPLPQCNSRGRLYQQPLQLKFPATTMQWQTTVAMLCYNQKIVGAGNCSCCDS